MLERLTVRDLALVERAEIELGRGLHVVTGETGAGKSMIVDSLGLLVGARADADVVREGAKAASVQGEFRLDAAVARRVGALLEEWGIAFDGETLIVRREVSAEGRSRALVNDASVTVASLKRLGESLLDLHGQHEHQSLLREGAALTTLDRLAGLEAERTTYADALAAFREASGELARLRESLATFAERRDYLASAAAELDEAQLVEGEQETLATDAARLAHADRLRELASAALERLSEGESAASASLGAARHVLEQAAALDASLDEVLAPVQDAAIAAEDAARTLARYLDHLEADPAALETVEARRDLYVRLVRKYRRPVPELVRWREELRAELGEGEDADGALERATARLAQAERVCIARGKALTRGRPSGTARAGRGPAAVHAESGRTGQAAAENCIGRGAVPGHAGPQVRPANP